MSITGLIVAGGGGHGKDTVCEDLRDRYGLRFAASSYACAERIVWPAMRARADMPRYATVEECFADRANHRPFWYETIAAYNTPDKARLGREIFREHAVYCGLRSAEELAALRAARLVQAVVWVDAAPRVPPESSASCTVTREMADYVIDNAGTLDELHIAVDAFMAMITKGSGPAVTASAQ